MASLTEAQILFVGLEFVYKKMERNKYFLFNKHCNKIQLKIR